MDALAVNLLRTVEDVPPPAEKVDCVLGQAHVSVQTCALPDEARSRNRQVPLRLEWLAR